MGERPYSLDGAAGIEYRLARNAVVNDVISGRVPQGDVCDAHPELLRAARNIGVSRNESCPFCHGQDTVSVTYVFGSGLPAGGKCAGDQRELNRLRRRPEPVQCFEVEVCPSCAWHHLTRRYPGGGELAKQKRLRAQA